MNSKNQNPNAKSRTYARNRTRLSRRGFDKRPESDGVFLSKLIASVFAGSFWIKFSAPFTLAGLNFTGFPLGLVLGVALIWFFEKRVENRKILYSVIVVCGILSFFLPSGIVL